MQLKRTSLMTSNASSGAYFQGEIGCVQQLNINHTLRYKKQENLIVHSTVIESYK